MATMSGPLVVAGNGRFSTVSTAFSIIQWLMLYYSGRASIVPNRFEQKPCL